MKTFIGSFDREMDEINTKKSRLHYALKKFNLAKSDWNLENVAFFYPNRDLKEIISLLFQHETDLLDVILYFYSKKLTLKDEEIMD